MIKTEIVLATSSKYRIKMFETLKIPFITKESNFNEYVKERPKKPDQLVKFLAKNKVKLLENKFKDKTIIGFDTVAFFNGKIYEKFKEKKEQERRLKIFNGKEITIYTGYYILNQKNKKETMGYTTTKIKLRKIEEKEIKFYVKNFDGNKFPLGFNMLEGYSLSFIKEIKGDYTSFKDAVPFEKIIEGLKKVNFNINKYF